MRFGLEQALPKVLVVDDETSNLKILKDLLSNNAQIMVAKDGKRALEIAKESQPQLILLDVIMPQMNGFEVIHTLKKDPETQDIPVIFITGLVNSTDEEMGLSLGAQDYIYKPFNLDVTRARVLNHLKIVRQRKELKELSNKLTKANEAKSQFLAHMSHEIRTPLTSVIGYADAILAEEFSQTDHKRIINNIGASGKHLMALVNDVLDLSKIEANKMQLETIEADLVAIIAELHGLLLSQSQDKDLRIVLDYRLPLPTKFLCDATRLKQVLFNLGANAVKFTRKGKITVSIMCQDNELIFSIKDTGCGIPENKMDTLFQAFEQAQESNRRRYGGTGLGLSIARKLIRLMQGDISLSSKEGQGSEFTVKIPLITSEDPVWITEPLQIETLKNFEDHSSEPLTLKGNILLAEDNDDIAALMIRIFERMGLNVTWVDDGEKLFETAITGKYDLIFSDIQLPKMEGTEACFLLKQTGIDTPVVALTANAMTHQIDGYMEAGFDAHLTKPLDRKRLAQTLNRYLGEQFKDIEIAIPQEEQQKLFNTFLKSMNTRLQELTQSMEAKDWNSMAQVAHSIRGAAALFDVTEVFESAKALENAIRHTSDSEEMELMTLAKQLEQECEKLSIQNLR